MKTFISFLRGVNMAGHNMIKMSGLLTMFREAGYVDAETYIQSGNIIFSGTSDSSAIEIATEIESAIRQTFGHDVTAMVRTIEDLKRLIPLNPFISEKHFDPSKSAVIFLNEQPPVNHVEEVNKLRYPPDRFEIMDREIFIYCPNGFGRTKLYTNFFENKLKVQGTSRNWNTINAIAEIAEKKQYTG